MSNGANLVLGAMFLVALAVWGTQIKIYSTIGVNIWGAVQENTLVQCQGLVLSDKSAAKRICSKLEEELQ